MSASMIGPNPFCHGQVLIESEVLVKLEAFRQHKSSDVEAGGLLLGFRRGPHLHITSCTEPFPTDRRTRTSFKRECAGHAKIAHERWRKSDEHMDYVGEWHSHPETEASPSTTDLYEWRVLLRNRPNALLFMIVGNNQHWYGIGLHSKIERVALKGTK